MTASLVSLRGLFFASGAHTHAANARRAAGLCRSLREQVFVEQKDVICSVAQETHGPFGLLSSAKGCVCLRYTHTHTHAGSASRHALASSLSTL